MHLNSSAASITSNIHVAMLAYAVRSYSGVFRTIVPSPEEARPVEPHL